MFNVHLFDILPPSLNKQIPRESEVKLFKFDQIYRKIQQYLWHQMNKYENIFHSVSNDINMVP